MKLTKRILSAVFVMLIMVTALSAQSRYKHVPRVKVDVNRTNIVSEKQELKSKPNTVTPTMEILNADEAINVESTITSLEETAVVVNTKEEVVTSSKKHKTIIGDKNKVTHSRMTNNQLFTEKAKSDSKLMDVKDVKKTNMETALLVMILLYAVGTVLLITGVLLLLLSYAIIPGLALCIAGGVMLIAASIMLTLFKMGVI